jgi:hypothetical protein
MAEDLTGLNPPFATPVFTLAGIDVATEVLLPKWHRRVSFRFSAGTGKYSHTGTDAAPIDAAHQTVGAGVLHSINTDRSGREGVDTDVVRIFLASSSAGAEVRMTLEVGAA